MEQGINTSVGKGNPEPDTMRLRRYVVYKKISVCNAGYAERMTGRRSEQIHDSGRNLRHIVFEFFQAMTKNKLYASVGPLFQIKTISRYYLAPAMHDPNTRSLRFQFIFSRKRYLKEYRLVFLTILSNRYHHVSMR